MDLHLHVQGVTAIGGPGNAQRVQYQSILKAKFGRIEHGLPSLQNPKVLSDAPGLVTGTRLTILAGNGDGILIAAKPSMRLSDWHGSSFPRSRSPVTVLLGPRIDQMVCRASSRDRGDVLSNRRHLAAFGFKGPVDDFDIDFQVAPKRQHGRDLGHAG